MTTTFRQYHKIYRELSQPIKEDVTLREKFINLDNWTLLLISQFLMVAALMYQSDMNSSPSRLCHFSFNTRCNSKHKCSNLSRAMKKRRPRFLKSIFLVKQWLAWHLVLIRETQTHAHTLCRTEPGPVHCESCWAATAQQTSTVSIQ